MNIDNLSNKSRHILGSVRLLAMGMGHRVMTPLHVAHVMLEEKQGVARKGVKACGGDEMKLLDIFEKALLQEDTVSSSPPVEPSYDQKLSQALVSSGKWSRKLEKDEEITPRVLLLSLLEAQDSRGEALWKEGGVKVGDLRSWLQKGEGMQKEGEGSALEKYGDDITERAREGKLDPVISRDEEIRRVAQVLSRRLKNNPILIGEPGVGKTAIVEGLAQRMAEGDVPLSLKDKSLVALDMASMVAGAKFRGEFEERLKSVLDEIKEREGEIICFIDELHTLVGTGANEGGMDAANILKPSLARGELHCIGATTLTEYRKYIEKDAALARRFQSVHVKEPREEETLAILRGLREKYEVHHGVTVTDSAMYASVKLAERYIRDRFFPDKAIDLVDEACARLRMILDSKPEELDGLERKLMRLRMEIEARSRDEEQEGLGVSDSHKEDAGVGKEVSGRKDRESLDTLRDRVSDMEAKAQTLNMQWEKAKKAVNNSQDLKVRLEKARYDMHICQQKGQFEEAGRLAYDVIPRLEKDLSLHKNHTPAMVREEDIASIVARSTGIPVEKMLEGEKDRLLHMEDYLRGRVVGQEEAIRSVSEAVRRSRAGLSDPHRPSGSFMFLGPTGVGKTELTKALASFLFGDDKAMTRMDMSEYMEKHSVARLIGAPPGYVGYEEGGTLTSSLRRMPYQVVLLDEIEKAHPEVLNVFLQFLDEGRLTDGQGHVVDCRHVLVVMTSNIGAEILLGGDGETIDEETKEEVMVRVRSSFRPEFINRLDDILMFCRLGEGVMGQVVDLRVEALRLRVEERGYRLRLSDEAREYLAREGWSSDYGARPLNRLLRRKVETPLSEMILREHLREGGEALIAVVEGQLGVWPLD
jgi:ATP-dependent Clp protease ATP-binding subunit ClpB